jgi:hypothetical protein
VEARKKRPQKLCPSVPAPTIRNPETSFKFSLFCTEAHQVFKRYLNINIMIVFCKSLTFKIINIKKFSLPEKERNEARKTEGEREREREREIFN